jgi:hypothetical protein
MLEQTIIISTIEGRNLRGAGYDSMEEALISF